MFIILLLIRKMTYFFNNLITSKVHYNCGKLLIMYIRSQWAQSQGTYLLKTKIN